MEAGTVKYLRLLSSIVINWIQLPPTTLQFPPIFIWMLVLSELKEIQWLIWRKMITSSLLDYSSTASKEKKFYFYFLFLYTMGFLPVVYRSAGYYYSNMNVQYRQFALSLHLSCYHWSKFLLILLSGLPSLLLYHGSHASYGH